jgi:hypothetical protein
MRPVPLAPMEGEGNERRGQFQAYVTSIVRGTAEGQEDT